MDCAVRKHDDHQFEVKVVYPLQRNAAEDRYALDMFIFLPYQVAVNAATYSRDQFYDDLGSYTRFKTPSLSLAEVNDRGNDLNPLTRVERHLDAVRATERLDEKYLRYELRVLANVVRVQVRDATAAIRQRVRDRASPGRLPDVSAAIDKLLDDLAATLRRIRELRPSFKGSSVPSELCGVYERVDEHVSIQVEGLLLHLLAFLRRNVEGADLEEPKRRLAAAIENELRHRRECGYPAFVSRDERRNEYFLYRQGLLKKFCASVLFLSEDPLAEAQQARQVLYAVAAALAMAFAVVVAWLVGRFYPANSLGFFIAVVIAYAFKDRIKDFLREFGGRMLPAWACDRSVKLTDPQYGKEVGRTREHLFWLDHAGLPEDIVKARQYQDSLERAVSEPTEVVLHYAKKVRIKTRAIYESHQRSIALDEILRMQIGRWLEKMDDPRRKLLMPGSDGRPLSGVVAARVYHVNLVLRLTSFRDGRQTLLKALLVLSRNGIERIET